MEQIILFAPLIGAIIAGFGWRVIGDAGAQWVTTGLLFLSALLSWIVFLGHDGTTQSIHILDWIQSGTLDTAWSIRLDRLTAIMLIVVTTVSALDDHADRRHHGVGARASLFDGLYGP